MSGWAVKSPIWPRMGNGFCATRKISFLLLSQDCLQARAQVRLLHRSRRTHRVPLRVQQNFEVTILTIKRRETEAILQKSKNNNGKSRQQSRNERSIARPPRVVRGVHRQSRRYRSASTRKHFSSLKRPLIYIHCPKDRNCEVCKRTRITRASLQEANWWSSPQRITKFSMRAVNLETITDMLSWYRIWPPNGSNRIRVKRKPIRRRKEVYGSF